MLVSKETVVLRRWGRETLHSDEGLTLETSAFNLLTVTVANLPYQLS